MADEGLILDFQLLDDLLLLSPQQAVSALASTRLRIAGIGPLVEYAVHRSTAPVYPPLTSIAEGSVAPQVQAAVENGGRFDLTSTALDALPFEFSPLPNATEIAGHLWRAFKNRLANAAVRAGFDNLTAKGLAGAFGELQDNARDHSNRPHTVVTGYRWCPGEFEMVVADGGVGVLASLRSHPDYQHLADHGEALKTALSPGETRYGRGSGHGTGFDTMFRNMASLQGLLRFRSGDHTLELNGTSPALIYSKLKQRPPFEGFSVSITCRPM